MRTETAFRYMSTFPLNQNPDSNFAKLSSMTHYQQFITKLKKTEKKVMLSNPDNNTSN